MVLDTENRPTAVTHAFQRAVVEVDMSRFDVPGKLLLVDREAVILRRDLDLLGSIVEDGLVGAAMPELEFEGFAS